MLQASIAALLAQGHNAWHPPDGMASITHGPRGSLSSAFALGVAGTFLLACGNKASPTDAPSLNAATLPAEAASASAMAGPTDGVKFPKAEGKPLVSLGGAARGLSPAGDGAPKVASIALETRVYAKPDTSSAKIGFLRAGAVIASDGKSVPGKGCPQGFRAIKPIGYVCIGAEATTDLEHPIVRASFRRPDTTEKLPYIYGTATRGGPAYARIPTEDDVKAFEPHLASHLSKWAHDKESGATYGHDLWLKWRDKQATPALEAMAQKLTDSDIPPFLKGGARVPNLAGFVPNLATVKAGEFARHNGVAFIDTFLVEGRRFGVSTDLRVFPTDRFRPIRGSEFHGVEIGKDVELPFAFARAKSSKKYRIEKGRLVSQGPLPWRSVVPLSGKLRAFGGKNFYEATDGTLVETDAVSRVDAASKMPGWAVAGEKWIDINVTRQVLTAYEGDKPVYATLVSTGEAGLGDPETTRSTKRGIFRIHTKFLTATMDSKVSGEEFELRDVPYVQYFQDGYALHAAYWHDVFGQPKSHGCINLTPEDARRLFFWTEPQVPEGWHGAAKALTGTVLFVHP
jgi:lipoprotein-anchoring transpeptidase ErfK/SrfK